MLQYIHLADEVGCLSRLRAAKSQQPSGDDFVLVFGIGSIGAQSFRTDAVF
jgi:hypothetical protein